MRTRKSLDVQSEAMFFLRFFLRVPGFGEEALRRSVHDAPGSEGA